jgi:hypothetical protein
MEVKGLLQSVVCVAIATSSLTGSIAAAEPDSEKAGADQENAALSAATAHMRRLKLRRVDDAEEVIGLIDQPLLAFGDSTRATSQGTLWAWAVRGRPIAFLELYQIGGFEGHWFHALALASEPNVFLDAPNNGRWQPQTSAFPLTPLEDAPEPAAKENARLRQFRDMARRFTAHEFWDPDNSRHELRVLPQPIHRYRVLEQNIQDGAAFAIVHGTNPEAVVVIEILDHAIDSERWQYAVFRSSDAEGHVELDGKEVCRWDRAVHSAKDLHEPYIVFRTPQETGDNEEPSNDAR